MRGDVLELHCCCIFVGSKVFFRPNELNFQNGGPLHFKFGCG